MKSVTIKEEVRCGFCNTNVEQGQAAILLEGNKVAHMKCARTVALEVTHTPKPGLKARMMRDKARKLARKYDKELKKVAAITARGEADE